MEYKEKFGELYKNAKDKFNIQQAPKLVLKQDKENKELIKEFTDRYMENMQSDEQKFYKRYET